MDLTNKLESLLFVASKPLNTAQLAKFTDTSEDAVRTALKNLSIQRLNSGIVVLEMNDSWQLATNPDNVELVKTFLNSDLRENLTDATLEVLAIIAYRQPISKVEIESIRGVNSQYSLRQLLMRGLVEKTSGDGRSTHYRLTTEFLQHMGLQAVEQLPEFQAFQDKLKLPEREVPTVENNAENSPDNL